MTRARGIAEVMLVVCLAACSSPKPAPVEPTGIDVKGTLTLTTTSLQGGTLEELMAGTKPCAGSGGYSDIADGAQVTVTDEAGTTVGLGHLGPGKYRSAAGACVFAFTVPGVKPGRPFYGIEVAHRGVVRYEAGKIASPALSLGS